MEKALLTIFTAIGLSCTTVVFVQLQEQASNKEIVRAKIEAANNEFHAARKERAKLRAPVMPVCGTAEAKGANVCMTATKAAQAKGHF